MKHHKELLKLYFKMFKTNQILCNYCKAAFLCVGFVVFCAEVSAQEIRDCDRNMEQERSMLAADPEEVSHEEYKPQRITASDKSKSAVKERKQSPIYKAEGEKDCKPQEMSTLSFNLFLYIVDRFKED